MQLIAGALDHASKLVLTSIQVNEGWNVRSIARGKDVIAPFILYLILS